MSYQKINVAKLLFLTFYLSTFAGVQAYTKVPNTREKVPVDPSCNDGNQGFAPTGQSWASFICTPTTFQYGYYSMGNFDLVKDNTTDYLKFPTAGADLSDTGWDLTISPLQYKSPQNQNSYAYGWLHVNLKASGSFRTPQSIIIQAYTELNSSAAAGAFVRTPDGGSCSPSASASSKAYYVPCGYAAEPLPFWGAVFARTAASGPLPTEYNLNFRLSFPWCQVYSSTVGVYFQAYIVGSKSGGPTGISLVSRRVIRFDTAKVSLVPAVDPFPPASAQSTITCSALSDSNKPPWIFQVLPPGNRAAGTSDESCILALCNWRHAYSARCLFLNTIGSAINPVHAYRCQNFKAITGFPDYYDVYRNEVVNLTYSCSNSCNNTIVKITVRGEETTTIIGGQVWGARKSHGVLMVFSYFGVYPLTSFVARYYKDDFMRARYVVNIHLWYAVHICGGILLLCLTISGGGIAFYGSIYFGRSRTLPGLAHRLLGYAAYGFCVLGILTNGLRCQRRPLRDLTILAHSLTGVLYQALSLLCILTSVYIPGSPTGTAGIDENPGIGGGIGAMVPIALLWTIFDVIMNVLLMLHIRRVDSYTFMNPRRTWVFGYIPTPTLRAEATRDYKDSIDRRDYLRWFTIGCAVATFIAVLAVSVPPSYGRVLGQMTLTHTKDGTLQYPPLFSEKDESVLI